MKIKALKVFASDEASEENGKWAPIADGIEFKIRRLRSKPVMDARRKIYGPHERAMRGKDELPDAIEQQLTIRLLSEAVLVDWRTTITAQDVLTNELVTNVVPGLVDDSGVVISFDKDAAASIFSDPETGKDLRAHVIMLSQDGDFFSPDQVEPELGN